MAGNGKSPEGEGEGEGEGGRVSQTKYLDGPILVDIDNIHVQIIAFASILSLFALSILIKKPILFF